MPHTGSGSVTASGDSASTPGLAGRQLGGYVLLRRLGVGAMAEVYLAQQTSLRRLVAVKLLKRHLGDDPQYVKRFQIEAQSAAALAHPNIVQIHEVGCQDGWHYIVQEYVPGKNLKEIMDRCGKLHASLVAHVLRQVAAALVRSAEHGIVHRDIKPENIMVSVTGDVKVADFGLARVADVRLDLTQAGITMGTPLYMSPEQVQGKPLDPRSDIYSLGVTAYHMLAGQPPFSADHAMGVAFHHVKSEPEPLASLRSDVSEELCRIVHRMLKKQPEERYQSAALLLADLRRLDIAAETDGNVLATAVDLADLAQPTDVGHLAATQALQAALVIAQSRAPARFDRWGLVMVLAAILAGLAAGYLQREPVLVGRSPDARSIPLRGNAWAQLYHAKTVDSESAWLSVKTYFPNDALAGELADQGLAMHFLQREQWSQALPIFSKFADTPNSLSYQAFGLAGECVVHVREGRTEEAKRIQERLSPDLLTRLDSDYPALRDLYEDAVELSERGRSGR